MSAAADVRPLPRRLVAFLIERFPPAPQVVFMVVLFVAATLMSALLLPASLTGSLGDVDASRAVLAFAGALVFILRLRVYDDVKDADTDVLEHPTRPIPRGLVTTRELDALSVALLLVEAALIAGVGTTTLVLWAVAAAWSVLMRVEFFVGAWLEARPALYAISHMVVMGLIFAMLLAIGVEVRGGAIGVVDALTDARVLLAMLAATLIGIGFEWGRKFPRYLAPHGVRGWALLAGWPVLGIACFTLLVRDAYPTWSSVALAVIGAVTAVVGIVLVARLGRRTDVDATLAERLELVPALPGLALYLVLAAAGVQELVA